jgi:hypothetical protein
MGIAPDPRAADLRTIGEINRSGWRSCWSSRTPTTRSTRPSAATCSRPAASCSPTPRRAARRPRGPAGVSGDMTVFAINGQIGATGLYLLFAWLLSAAIGSWVSDRKGYGERVGLTFGLLLTVVGLLIVLLLPGRPGSRWKLVVYLPCAFPQS